MEKLFIKEFKYYLLVFQILAITPFKLKNRNGGRRCIDGIYCLISVINPLVIFSSGLFLKKVVVDNALSAVVSGLVFISLIFTHIIVLIQSYAFRNDQLTIFKKFSEIDDIFVGKLNIKLDYRRMRWKHITKVGLFLPLLIIFFLVNIYVGQKLVGYTIHCILSIVLIHMRCLQVIFFVDLLTERLEFMEKIILNIINESEPTKRSSILFVRDHYKRLSLTSRDINFSDEKMRFEKMCLLKSLYGTIWDICELMNKCFGWSLLAIMTFFFIDFTSKGYWLFLALEDEIPHRTLIHSLTFIISDAILLILLSNSCLNCTDKSAQIAVLLHKIEDENEFGPYNALAREFSLQILHEPIYISANGFFKINFNLVGSMVAATITYLVILIQFQLVEKTKYIESKFTTISSMNTTNATHLN